MAVARPGVVALQRIELQAQTFDKVARGNSGGLQRLHDSQRRLELSGRDARRERREVGERLAQEPILIERIDNEMGEIVITLRQSQQQQLLSQRVVQRRRRGGPLRPIRRVVARGAAVRRGEIQLPVMRVVA